MQTYKGLSHCFTELSALMKFVIALGALPWGEITVTPTDSTEIFASTCLMKLSIPSALINKDQDSFNTTMRAACRSEGKAFTSVLTFFTTLFTSDIYNSEAYRTYFSKH